MPVPGSSWKHQLLSVLLAAAVSAVGQAGFVKPVGGDRAPFLPSGISEGIPIVTTDAQDDPNLDTPSGNSASAGPDKVDSGNPIIKATRSETKPPERF